MKNYHGIIERPRNGIAERASRRVKQGTSVVVLQSGLDERWWAPLDSILSVSNENFSRGGREFTYRTVGKFDTIHWNVANLVKTQHGIIVFQHSTDLTRIAWMKDRHAE